MFLVQLIRLLENHMNTMLEIESIVMTILTWSQHLQQLLPDWNHTLPVLPLTE